MSNHATPLISICIPVYKREDYLEKLLDSISIQTYKNFEVVLTDDSNDDLISQFILKYKNRFTISYYRNPRQLGTPENWNESIRRARGEWIKLMHDDDWFSGSGSVATFAAAVQPGIDFIFSAYENVYEGSGKVETVKASLPGRKLLAGNPVALLSGNVVGPPSVTLYRKTGLEYDKRMKWRVDVDFYVHYLQTSAFAYIDKPLVKIGISQDQVTQSCFLVPEVEIPENFLLLQKIGVAQLKNILAYDSWWRLMRNLHIRSLGQISASGFKEEVPPVIAAMINHQTHLPAAVLKVGIFSKFFMLVSYLRWKFGSG